MLRQLMIETVRETTRYYMGELDQPEATVQTPVAPQLEENAPQNELNALKETYIKVAKTIDQLKEPVTELSILRDAMRAAVITDRCEQDAAFAKFLWDDLGPGLAKRLNKERSNDEKYLEVVGDVLEVLVRLFSLDLKAKRFNFNFYSAMTLLFNHEAVIHKYHFQIPDTELKKLRTAGQSWREELQVGSWVDAYVKADERGRLGGWMQAQISSIDKDSLYIEFPLSSNQFDGSIDRWSTELTAFESKTKEDYAWRATFLESAEMLECDIHDKSVWCKGTVFEVKKQTISSNRIIHLAYCAFRVYRENPTSLRKDERGAYEGWSVKFDEWIPAYSPRIMPFASKLNVTEEEEIEEEMDELIECDPEFQRIYAVPRVFNCISACYLRYINIFGNEGGFDRIIDILTTAEISDSNAPDQLNINIMGCLAQILTMPYSVFHKDFIAEKGAQISKSIQHRLLSSSDQSLRNVRKEQVDAIIKSVDQISRRFMVKEERDKQAEVLRLELANKCLRSTYLERRISGIKDLNTVIKNNTLYMSSKTFTTEFLIDWMISNEVFTTLWDARKTHAQLVQRSGEVFKLLLKEDRLDENLLKLFWSLTKSDYQVEVFKIISETSFYLKQPQIEFLFKEITSQVADKLSLAEFDCLCDLGKVCKNQEFQNKVSDFFWHIIVNSESFKDDLVENSTKKFAEMVKYWPIDQKKPLFVKIVGQLGQYGITSLPTLRLFTKIIKDQLSRPPQDQSKTVTNSGGSGVYPANNVVTTYTNQTSSGNVVTSYSFKPQDDVEESIYNTNQQSEPKSTVIDAWSTSSTQQTTEKELTFSELLNSLSSQLNIVDILLENLTHYCRIVSEAEVDPKCDRRKLHVLSNKYSHADEIEERLQFLKYYASVSVYQFRKVQLRVIYDSLSTQSPILSDQIEFLNWCKQACESTTSQSVILDLNEVGEYFTELILDKSISVETLPLVGFEFIQNYFISINENDSNILRQQVQVKLPVKQVTANVQWTSYYVAQSASKEETEVEEIASGPSFKVLIHPMKLLQLDLIWMVVMESKNSKVIQRSVDFLIQIYMSLDDGLFDERTQIAQYLITRCISLLKEPSITSIQVQRVVMILRSVIQESEKKGAGDVQPHNAILKGESLDRIIIKNQTRPNQANLVVRVLTSATVWEFVDKVSRMIDLAPHYVEFRLGDGSLIKDTDYGKTLGEISFKNYDIVTVKKLDFEDEVISAHVIDPETNELTERATVIFSEWFDAYSNEEGFMTPETTTLFIQGATNEVVPLEDARIQGLFKVYDQNKDGKIEREEFLTFWTDAAREKVERVYDNLKNHFIRQDLVRLSDVVQSYSFTKEEMPRYTLSHNQDQFDTLMALLDRKDESSDQVWELIRMLATNQKIYDEVISIEKAVSVSGEIDWKVFFDGDSVYRQIYNLEIIEAIMEDDQSMQPRVVFVSYQDSKTVAEPKPKQKPKWQSQAENTLMMKQTWSNKFLQNGGLNYVYSSFVNCETKNIHEQFHLKKTNFMLAILRVFVSAAICSQDGSIQHTLTLARRASSLDQEKSVQEADAQGTHLMKIFAGSIAEEFLDLIDFSNLQNKLLTLIADIVSRETHSFEEKNIVSNSLNLWIGCVLYRPELFLDFLIFDRIDEVIMSGILYCSAEKIREDFKFTLLALAKELQTYETESPLGFQLKLLSKNFHKISMYPCRQFFDLFNELIDFYFVKVTLGSEESDLFDPEQLLSQIIDKIRADKAKISQEPASGEVDEAVLMEQAVEKERLMIGLVQLTGKIIAKVDQALSEKIVSEKDLINEIFKEFLFSSVFSSQSSSKSQSGDMLELIKAKMVRKSGKSNSQRNSVNKSREAAYQLLNELIKKSPVILSNFIKNQLQPLLDLIKRPKQWNYTPPSSSERIQKYVGLKNLGCICYMNSMLQQFFMIPAFRYNLLCVDDGVKDNIVEYKHETIDDNMLHQIQRLLAHLELSERNDYNPLGFTFSFKEFDGTPTNISEQKDAQEFLNVLFDRVENALKPTPRKYLLQSIFGGKTCSQLVCQECGKIKNRIEDYYNLSLTVKDIKSVYDSLAKQVEGEVINDYQCDGCNKKVDVSKRVLIAETPNVLILHLQRIVFNFDTFRNDKLNQHFEFPTVLDLKPYSYYDVMKREQRLPKEQPKNEEEDEVQIETTQDPTEVKPAENEDDQMPIEDDCFEYKLVGVNVHSGSANAGHYWSYINTSRGLEEKDSNDPSWLETDKDQWMEFNDSTVKDYSFSNLKDECFGDKPTGASASFQNAWGLSGSYGKSGYMLFYERRIKKPIRIVVSSEAAATQPDVIFNEKTKEHIKLISYREGIDKETPNQIFQKVLEDNTKFTFENDIYSQEFFDFLKQILQNVAQFGQENDEGHHIMRTMSLQVAKKVAFDILARCFYNQGIKELVQVMISIFKQDKKLIVSFCTAIIENNNGEAMLEILLDCTDQLARTTIAFLFKFLLCSLKEIEKEELLSLEEETLTQNDQVITQPKAVCARYMNLFSGLLNTRVAKAWPRFENFLDMVCSFVLYSSNEIEASYTEVSNAQGSFKYDSWTTQSEACQTGLEYFFKTNMLERLLDFILGSKSPIAKSGESRVTMGGTYAQPNVTAIMKIVTTMIGDKLLVEKYPLSEITGKMMQNKEILGKILEENASNKDFAAQLTGMCFDNFEMTRKIAKVFLKSVNQPNVDKVSVYLKSLKKFLLINDSLKIQRLEWIFGVSQLVSKSKFRSNNKYEYGIELVDRINDEAFTYVSTLMTTHTEDALMTLLLKQRGRMDTFCIKALKDLISLSLKDVEIARYVYRQAPPSYQYARYSDWFKGYIELQQQELEKSSMSAYTYYQARIQATQKAVGLMEKFDAISKQFAQEDLLQLREIEQTDEFVEVQKSWLPLETTEVIMHYPPQYIIGKQVNDDREIARYENEHVLVTVQEIDCEYMYSNPTGLFNLSLPDKLMRTKNYTFVSYKQVKDFQNNKDSEKPDASVDSTRDWQTYHKEGPVMVLLQVKSKVNHIMKVEVELSIIGDHPNISIPKTTFKYNVFSNDTRVFANFQKLAPGQPWNGTFAIKVVTAGMQSATGPQAITYSTVTSTATGGFGQQDNVKICPHCAGSNFVGESFCKNCGQSMDDDNDPQDGVLYAPGNDNYFN